MTSQSEDEKQLNVEKKMVTTILLIILSFVICWMPMAINFVIVIVAKDPKFLRNFHETFEFVFYAVAYIAIQLNMIVDPMIYAYRVKEVRDSIKQFFNFK